MLERFNALVDRFNEKASSDEKIKKHLAGLSKKIVLQIEGVGTFHSSLNDMKLSHFEEGDTDSPDIRVKGDESTFTAILDKKMKPYIAVMKKKIKLEGSLTDILLLRELLK